jgi:hypothetical protein
MSNPFKAGDLITWCEPFQEARLITDEVFKVVGIENDIVHFSDMLGKPEEWLYSYSPDSLRLATKKEIAARIAKAFTGDEQEKLKEVLSIARHSYISYLLHLRSCKPL